MMRPTPDHVIWTQHTSCHDADARLRRAIACAEAAENDSRGATECREEGLLDDWSDQEPKKDQGLRLTEYTGLLVGGWAVS